MNGLIDFDFDLTKNEDIHEHYTRHRRDLHLPRTKTNKGKQRPTYQASIDFNNLERELKNATSLHNFKKLLKILILFRPPLYDFFTYTYLSLSIFICFPLQTYRGEV